MQHRLDAWTGREERLLVLDRSESSKGETCHLITAGIIIIYKLSPSPRSHSARIQRRRKPAVGKELANVPSVNATQTLKVFMRKHVDRIISKNSLSGVFCQREKGLSLSDINENTCNTLTPCILAHHIDVKNTTQEKKVTRVKTWKRNPIVIFAGWVGEPVQRVEWHGPLYNQVRKPLPGSMSG